MKVCKFMVDMGLRRIFRQKNSLEMPSSVLLAKGRVPSKKWGLPVKSKRIAMINKQIGLIEGPRDAIQGLSGVISTDKKIAYINTLIESALFTCIDFGSFVSPKAVPQMQDSALVLEGLVKSNDTKLL